MNRSPRSTRKLLNYKPLHLSGDYVPRDIQVPRNQNAAEQPIDCPSVSSSITEEESVVHSLELSTVLPFHDEQLSPPQSNNVSEGEEEFISQSPSHSSVLVLNEQSVSLSEDQCETNATNSPISESQESSFSDFLNQYSHQHQADQALTDSKTLDIEINDPYLLSENLHHSHSPSTEKEPTVLPEIASWLRGLASDLHSDQGMADVPTLKVAQKALGQDIDDFLDENPIDECSTIGEVEVNVGKLEDYRGLYRRKHGEYKTAAGGNFDEDSEGKEYEERLGSMKKYILAGKKAKKGLITGLNDNAEAERKAEKAANTKSCNFLINEIVKFIQELKVELECKTTFTDEEIRRKKQEIPQCTKKLENISKLVKDLHDTNKDVDGLMVASVDQTTQEYDEICKLKTKYVSFITKEAEDRELNKKDKFNESKLMIKIPKFSGYESKLDIYTFINEFNKMHERSVPKHYQCDVLKNNFLEGSALALVKNIDDIDEVWERLKTAYGDPKLLLKGKLSEIESVGSLSKTKNAEKVSESLAKLVNIMRDLMKLARDHKIEEKLYSGDGLDKVYNLLGDDRLTKWLTSIADREDITDKRVWTNLIAFLESDMKIQHQKILILKKQPETKPPDKPPDNQKNNSGQSQYQSSHFTNVVLKTC